MGWVMLAFLAMVAVFTLLAYVIGRWMSDYVQRHIRTRLDALDQLVNEEQVPVAWLKPYRRKAAQLRASGAPERRIRKLELAARKQCLIRIEELRRYTMGSGIADTGDTKRMIVASINEQAQRWQDDAVWHDLVDFTRPEPVAVKDADSD
jgi:hypothetical protein